MIIYAYGQRNYMRIRKSKDYVYGKWVYKVLGIWKVDYHVGGKWFIYGPKRLKENQLLSLKHPCWLSLV